MAALLLLSAGLGAVPSVVETHRRGSGAPARVGFVAAAAAIYPQAPWVDADRRALAGFGYSLVEIDLATTTGAALDAVLDTLDVLYLAGGNTFALLDAVRRSGLDALLPGHLVKGLVYVGASAGAVVAGPDIEPIGLMDDSAEVPALESTAGLGLVDVVPVPHADGALTPYSPSIAAEIVATYGETYPLRTVGDREALLVVDGVVTLVRSA